MSDICFQSEENRDSIIWFDIGYESFYKYDIIQNKDVAIPSKLKPYCEKVFPFTLYIDSRNILWLSSDLKGFVGYDLIADKLILPNFNIGQNDKPKILKMEEDASGNLWLGTTSGMYIYYHDRNEISEQQEIRLFLDKNKLSDYAFRFTIDTKGKVWIFSTQKYEEDDALYSYDPKSKECALLLQDDYPPLKILKSLEGIVPISSNKLLITSFNGFCVVNTSKASPTFELFDVYNEKPLGGFKNCITDHKENVWMSSDYGVTRFDSKTSTITKFDYLNSNVGDKPTPMVSFSHKTNTIFLSQNLAINTIDTDDLKMAKPGKVILSDIKIKDYYISALPSSGETVLLNYDQNSIDLHFTNLNFTNSQNNAYLYTIDESKDDWITMTNNHLKFDNLGYGKYTLKVKAENSFGLMSPNEFVLNIVISPPFWRTWWFNGLIILLISFTIYSFFKYRDIQRKKLDKLRHHIARDLHDDMGSTLSHIKMMSEREAMRKEANHSFQTIADKTAEVMNNMTEIIWSINPKNDSLKNIIGKIQEFAIDTLEPLGIEISFDIDDVPTNIKLNPEDRRHFYLIFKEAINNTAKYSQAKNVHFSFKSIKGKMLTKFADDGLGFDPLLINRGNGLKNMANRAKLLHGQYEIITNNDGTSISLTLKN